MKRMIMPVLLFGALTLIGFAFAPKISAQAQEKETVVVEITEPLKLLDTMLQGSYIFEHDEGRMAKGEPCMYVYANNNGKPGKLVTSFHCTPVDRDLAKNVVLSVMVTSEPGVWKLKEIQFPGTKKGHLIP